MSATKPSDPTPQESARARRPGLSQFIRWTLLKLYLSWTGLRNRVAKLLGGHAYYAEFGGDKVVREHFFPDLSHPGTLIEVGCATPKLISFSQHFRETGWRCIGVEPNPQFVQMHVAEGNEVYPYAAADFEQEDVPFTVVEDSGAYTDQTLSAHSFSALSIREDFARYRGGMVHSLNHREIRVSVRRLDTILEQAAPPVDTVDVVSIDVEGYELDVMRGFSPHRYRVRVIILENLFHKDEYTEYMRSIDYKLWKKLGYNYFYIPDPARPVEPA